jgi:hypothetical protein
MHVAERHIVEWSTLLAKVSSKPFETEAELFNFVDGIEYPASVCLAARDNRKDCVLHQNPPASSWQGAPKVGENPFRRILASPLTGRANPFRESIVRYGGAARTVDVEKIGPMRALARRVQVRGDDRTLFIGMSMPIVDSDD